MFGKTGCRARQYGRSGAIVAGILLCCTCSLWAKQVGKFMYRGAPEDFASTKFYDTVTVSDTMVAMSEKIRVMSKFLADFIMDTPSIFFIIDNSLSMSYTDLNDALGNRFKVTSAFIDSISQKFPTAEIGYAAVRGILYFRSMDNTLFKPFPVTYDTSGAYLPLRKLNGTYGGQTGLAIAKQFLETKEYPVPPKYGTGNYTDLTYKPSDENEDNVFGTNINIGFDVAKEAFSNSVQKTKESHYIIFLSDGDANSPGNNTFEFVNGNGVPTSYTVFFTKNLQVPPNINNMTANIQANGYSNSNPKSKYWGFVNTDFNKLLNFLIDNVLDSIVVSKPAPPISISVTGQTANSWNPVDSSFVFNTLFPLTGRVTPFTYQIKFPTQKSGDTTQVIDFRVKTQAGFIMPPADFEVKLWERDILFSHNTTTITVATESMNPIELSFPWNGGTADYRYTNVSIELSTVVPPIDRETIPLTAAGSNVFSGTFTRASSATKTPGNGILENAVSGEDSIIAVFRNSETPKLPLDTLRVAIAVNPPVFLDSAVTKDLNGNGYLDQIVLSFDKAVVIAKTAGSSFTVKLGSITFPVDSVGKLTDNTYVLYLAEQRTGEVLQTSWKPFIGVSSIPGVKNIVDFPSLDGAPPVIGTVVKEIFDPLDNRKDIVTVAMSEKVLTKGHVTLTLSNQPAHTFYAWIRQQSGVFTRIDDMFATIANFTAISYDSILVFAMTNDKDLTNNNWVNLQWLSPQPLCDDRDNFPTDSNRKVRVRVISPPPILTIFPNPSSPTAKHYQNGDFHFQHEPNAWDWVWKDNAGTVISIKNVVLPPFDKGKLKGYVKIYDPVGNTVNWTSGDNIFSKTVDPISPVPEMNIYWSGLNKAGMPVAPGVYRVVVYLDYPDSFEEKDVKFFAKAGIRRGL